MPKGRMLNKKISYSEKIAKLTLKASHLYTWCIAHLDFKGRIYASPEYLKGTIIPYIKEIKIEDIPKCITEWVNANLVIHYGNEVKYLEFIGFTGEQNLREGREHPSEIPTPAQLPHNSRTTPGKDKIREDKISSEPKGSSQMSLLLEKRMKDHNPSAKINTKGWDETFDKMIRIDKRTEQEILDMINFVQDDDFWYANILSADKLRKQWDKLYLKKKGVQAKDNIDRQIEEARGK